MGIILGNVISFICYPIFVHLLGTERFGVSSIAGAVVGYFMIFDLGLGRASIIVLGQAVEKRDKKAISGIFWSGQMLMFGFGALGAIVLSCITPYLCRHVLNVPQNLIPESISALILISASIPVMIIYSAHLGFLSNLRLFRELNAIRTLMNILTWVGPIIALKLRCDLVSAFGTMLLVRVIMACISLIVCLKSEPFLKKLSFSGFVEMRELFVQGGWMSITNLISPLMSYMDRALLGTLASLTAVSYYSIAGDTAQKLWIVQAAVVGALFPTLPGLLISDRRKAVQSCTSAFKMLLFMLIPLVILVSSLGPWLLRLWIGKQIATEVALPFAIVLLGTFVNSFAHIPFSLLAADGKSKKAAILHLFEAPFFFGLLYFLVKPFGAVGAAMAWTIRVILDAGVMLWMGVAVLPEIRPLLTRDMTWIGVTSIPMICLCLPIPREIGLVASGLVLMAWANAYWGDIKDYSRKARERLVSHRQN